MIFSGVRTPEAVAISQWLTHLAHLHYVAILARTPFSLTPKTLSEGVGRPVLLFIACLFPLPPSRTGKINNNPSLSCPSVFSFDAYLLSKTLPARCTSEVVDCLQTCTRTGLYSQRMRREKEREPREEAGMVETGETRRTEQIMKSPSAGKRE